MTDEAPLSLCWVPSRECEWELRRVLRADGDVVVTEEEGEVGRLRRRRLAPVMEPPRRPVAGIGADLVEKLPRAGFRPKFRPNEAPLTRGRRRMGRGRGRMSTRTTRRTASFWTMWPTWTTCTTRLCSTCCAGATTRTASMCGDPLRGLPGLRQTSPAAAADLYRRRPDFAEPIQGHIRPVRYPSVLQEDGGQGGRSGPARTRVPRRRLAAPRLHSRAPRL